MRPEANSPGLTWEGSDAGLVTGRRHLMPILSAGAKNATMLSKLCTYVAGQVAETDLWYVENHRFALDLRILVATPLHILPSRSNAY